LDTYNEYAKVLKAISDPKRLKIVDMLSCRELCACDIREKFNITQPTLSHDMKQLCNAGVVTCRKEGKWIYYSLNKQILDQFYRALGELFSEKDRCICNK
jgi:ArsR family transcriptional regulator